MGTRLFMLLIAYETDSNESNRLSEDIAMITEILPTGHSLTNSLQLYVDV